MRSIGSAARRAFSRSGATGFPSALLDDAWTATREFFDLPVERKMRLAMPSVGYPYGYAPYRSEALALSLGEATPPDLKETFSIGPESSWRRRVETRRRSGRRSLPGYASLLRRYHREMGGLAARIMALFARALGLPRRLLRSLHRSTRERPPRAELPAHSTPRRQAGQLRAGAHSDYGSVTILRAEPGSSGLQIEAPDGTWVDVPAEPDAFVVNVGDLLARWSNDQVDLHPPPRRPRWTTGDSPSRSSTLPNWDAVIECVPGEPARHAPVVAGEHLMQKFERSVNL